MSALDANLRGGRGEELREMRLRNTSYTKGLTHQ